MYVINNISETGSLFFADGTARKIDFTLTLTRVDESLAALYGDIGEQAKSTDWQGRKYGLISVRHGGD